MLLNNYQTIVKTLQELRKLPDTSYLESQVYMSVSSRPVPSRPVLFTQSVIYVGIELLWQLKRPLDQCQILQDIEELLKSKT